MKGIVLAGGSDRRYDPALALASYAQVVALFARCL